MNTNQSLRRVFDSYRALLRKTNALADSLFRRHAEHLHCRRGCYYCCTTISVTPVEFAWVGATLSQMRRSGESARELGPDSDVPAIPAEDDFVRRIPGDSELAEARRTPRCALLRDGVCSVYHARPIICRVHGLPLAYPVLEYDEKGRRIADDDPEVALVWCDLNFQGYDMLACASQADIVSMRDLYAQLETLNQQFLSTDAGRGFQNRGQVELDRVLELTPHPLTP